MGMFITDLLAKLAQPLGALIASVGWFDASQASIISGAVISIGGVVVNAVLNHVTRKAAIGSKNS